MSGQFSLDGLSLSAQQGDGNGEPGHIKPLALLAVQQNPRRSERLSRDASKALGVVRFVQP